MLLHCTRKLADKLPEVAATPLVESSPLGSWHAHLVRYDRRQCVLFCHDDTRYCLFLPGLVKTDFAELGRQHRELFLASLVVLKVPQALLDRVAISLGPARFDRATDRSVLGSMRTAALDLDWLIHDVHVLDCNPLAVSVKLNERPTSIKRTWLFPDRAMLERIDRLSR